MVSRAVVTPVRASISTPVLPVTVAVQDEFMSLVHEYPDITIHLTVFNAYIAEGVPQLLEHNDVRWIPPKEIKNYDFCPADNKILEKIAEVYHD